MIRRHITNALAILILSLPTAHALDTKEVVSRGIGSTVESASQNAAENALREVVGAFIDTKQEIEKRSQIADGIREEIKNVSLKTSEYSQGSIKKFETIEAKQENGLWMVDALVEVRIEDFRAYIRKVAFGESEVKLDSLTAMKSDVKQEETLNDFLVKPLSLVASGEVVEIKINEPRPFSRFVEQYGHGSEPGSQAVQSSVRPVRQRLLQAGWKENRILAIPFTTTIRRDFLENFFNQLTSTASEKRVEESLGINSEDEFYVKFGPRQRTSAKVRLFDYFKLPLTDLKQFHPIASRLNGYGSDGSPQGLRLTLYDKERIVIGTSKFPLVNRYQPGGEGDPPGVMYALDYYQRKNESSVFDDMENPFHTNMSHLHFYFGGVKSGMIQVLVKREGVIFIHLSNEQLEQLNDLDLAYTQS